MEDNYTPYGEEWKKAISKLSKDQIIEMASTLGKQKEAFHEIVNFYLPEAKHRLNCIHYLLTVEPDKITVEDCLKAIGFIKNTEG